MSRFGGGGARARKKQTVIDKLKAFFERSFGIGGSAFTETPASDKVVNYTDLIQEQPALMVAEESAPYGKKQEDK